MECVFADSEGMRIHSSIWSHNVRKFIPLLTEGCLCDISKASVEMNKRAQRCSDYPFKLLFIFSTIVKVEDPNFPEKISNTIKVTIWSEEWMEMIRQMYIKDSVDADFIIIQMFKAKIYEHTVSIGETFYVSNIIFSQECADILECKKRFSSNSLLKRSKTIISASTFSSFEDDLQLGVNNITTIHALYTNCQVGNYWLYGKILDFDTRRGWWYLSFKNCMKSLDFDPLFPEELHVLIGREMMTKMNVKNASLFNENSDDANENKHTIIKICTDENIISKYACNMNPSQADSTCDDVKTPHKVDCGFVVTVEIDDDSSVKKVLFDGDGSTNVSSKMQKKITVKIENN